MSATTTPSPEQTAILDALTGAGIDPETLGVAPDRETVVIERGPLGTVTVAHAEPDSDDDDRGLDMIGLDWIVVNDNGAPVTYGAAPTHQAAGTLADLAEETA